MKQNVIMAVLRKANSHSVDLYRLIKNQKLKRGSRRKTDSNFDFSQTFKCSCGFKKKECYVVHIIQLFLHQRTQQSRP